MNYSVVIPAAGSGSRLQLGYNKILYEYAGKTILEHTLEIFCRDPRCKQIIVVHSKEDEAYLKQKLATYPISFVIGGSTRSESVYEGLKNVTQRLVLIHDGARPFVQQEHIDVLMETLREYQACIVAVPCKDTIKIVKENVVHSTPDRATLWQAQTPQAFHTELILHAYEQAKNQNANITDDASAVEQFTDQKVKVVMGSYDNVKITTIEDLYLFERNRTK